MKVPVTGLFDLTSIYFTGPLPTYEGRNKYALIAVQHLSGWPIGRATRDETAATVIDFMKEEVLFQFGPPKVVLSDNATFFTEKKLANFINANATSWKTVLEYAPMSNGRAERMVGTLKSVIKKLALGSGQSWDTSLMNAVYGYRCRRMRGVVSPFELLYGVPPG